MALTQISTAGVKDDAVTAGKIPANAVGSSELADNAVDTAAIADDAVTQAKLATNSVGSGELKSTAVTTAKITDANVTLAKLATDSVGTDKIIDNAVTTAKIADQAVTLAKLPHGTSSNNGKFLRANNGADPTFETVTSTTINNNTNDYIVTATGTANTLQGEPELRWQNGNNLFVRAGDGESATLNLIADRGDDFGDGWKIQSEQDENDLTFKSDVSGGNYVDKLKLKSNGTLEVQGGLTTTAASTFGEDVTFTGTNANIVFDKSADAIEIKDNAELRVGTGDDLKIYHTSNTNIIDSVTSNLYFKRAGATSFALDGNGDIYIPDSKKTYWGNGADLTIYHDGTTNIIEGLNGNMSIRPKTGENGILLRNNGAVELYHDDAEKLQTTSYGTKVHGYKSQSSYVGFFVRGDLTDHGFGTEHGSGITNFDVAYISPIPMFGSKTIGSGSSYLSFPSYASGNYIKFTAPVDGLYMFELMCSWETHSGNDWLAIGWEKNTTSDSSSGSLSGYGQYASGVFQRSSVDSGGPSNLHTVMHLDANDTAVLYQQSCAAVRWKGSEYYVRGTLIS